MMSCFQEMSVLSDLVETLVVDIWILFNISAAFSWKGFHPRTPIQSKRILLLKKGYTQRASRESARLLGISHRLLAYEAHLG
jgi:hypothetical protein